MAALKENARLPDGTPVPNDGGSIPVYFNNDYTTASLDPADITTRPVRVVQWPIVRVSGVRHLADLPVAAWADVLADLRD